MAESYNVKSIQLKINGEYIAFTDPLLGFKWQENTEVYDGNDFFEKDYTICSGSASFTTTFKCLPRKPKSKKRRIQKKFLTKWYKAFDDKVKAYHIPQLKPNSYGNGLNDKSYAK